MSRPRNIVFIFSDQHNPKFTGYEGHVFVQTPHLDRLVEQGVSFNAAYTPNPICVPARHAMLSGTYTRNNCVYLNNAIPPISLPSFARYLSEQGWRTCLVGKGHFHGRKEDSKLKAYVYRGYQERLYGDLLGTGHQSYPFRGANPELEGAGSGHGNHAIGGTFTLAGPSGIPEFQESEHQVTSEAIKWLQVHRATQRDRPFLLSVHYPKPHFPWQPPRRWFEAYREIARGQVRTYSEAEMQDRLPVHQTAWNHYLGFGATQEDLDRGLAGYAGNVSYLDEMIGHLMASMEYMGYLKDTLIIYASDHGDMAGAHGLWHKQLFYEESARVPLIFSGPGVAEGERRDPVVSLVDLFPTLCDVAGLEIPNHCDGLSLAPLLEAPGELPDRLVFSEIVFQGPHWRGAMVRHGPWKYCWYVGDQEELYHLDEDPLEDVNLVGDPDVGPVQQRLREALLDWWQPDDLERRIQLLPKTTKEDRHFWPFQHVLPENRWVDAYP